MWQVRNSTPFAHHAAAFRDHRGRSFWGVWVAATFALREGLRPLFVMPQQPVAQAPVFAGDDPQGVLLRDQEVTPARASIDLVLRGAGPATRRAPAEVSFRLGGWSKRLRISPDPDDGGRVPLDWTRAPGGPDDPDNPLGRSGRGNGRGEGRGDGPLPRLTAVTGRVPALGPVPRAWPARAALGGTYDRAWQRTRAPLLPTDFDPAFWQVAPEDQRIDPPWPDAPEILIGGLEGTGPVDAPSAYPLPALSLLTSTRIGGRWQPRPGAVQSVEIDLETGLVRLVQLTTWPIPSAAEDVTIERTVIALDGRTRFAVAPGHARLFHGATDLEEAPT
ncbi:DUF2169 domain-containing protein [Mesobaculum littorinae]|uniref:DUF2169 domain-containing protein n=1 Tax=Mesobaculum littorinae TaxID=2486419 RepID=A0A438AI58_9RHOB|nr:DUF2169 domain-containing protein [Mesobaculum littorinae]RVV98315.1 DUF2169 domain-containing protein [Mesobaculum littorinae]